MLKLDGLSLQCAHNKFSNISLRAQPGEVVRINARNDERVSELLAALPSVTEKQASAFIINHYSLIREKNKAQHLIGFALSETQFSKHLTGYEILDLIGAFHGLPSKSRHNRINELSDQLNLNSFFYGLVAHYTPSQRSLLSLSSATIHSPSVVVLDNITLGLDYLQIKQVEEFISSLRETAIIFYDNYLDFLSDQTVNHIFITGGEITHTGSINQLALQLKTSSKTLGAIYAKILS